MIQKRHRKREGRRIKCARAKCTKKTIQMILSQKKEWESIMERQRVSSSNIHSVGYEPTSRELEIEFSNGAVYMYLNVPESVHTALMHSSSKGHYLNENIKNRFRCRKIRQGAA